MKNDMYSIMKDGFLDITIGDWLHRVSEFYPDQDAVVNVDRGVRLSWKQLDRRACEVAKGRLARGVRRDDKVASWATNYPEWRYLLFGCAKIGAVLVMVLGPDEVEQGVVTIRNMQTHHERTVELKALRSLMERFLGARSDSSATGQLFDMK